MRAKLNRFFGQSFGQTAKLMPSLMIVAVSSVLLVVFQNCGGLEADFNPLYDSELTDGCMGVNCERDLSQAGFKVTLPGVILEQRATTSSAAACDGATCFDLGGFCETGGFPKSTFYYQWLLAGQAAGAEVKSDATCDENGRFRVHVKVPFAQFDWAQAHRLVLMMKVTDESGVEQMNSNGEAQVIYAVSVRN